MRILVVGAGAVGGYFAALWSKAGRDVTLLVREGRRSQLSKTGLAVVREDGVLSIDPAMLIAAELDEPYDVVFLTVPGHGLVDAIRQLPPAIGPDTAIVSSLNGVRHFDALKAAFGDHAVLGSVVKCVTTLDESGRILELASIAQIVIGTWSGVEDPRLAAIAAQLGGGGIDAQVSSAITAEISEKWLMMVALGAAGSLLGGDVGAINTASYGAWTVQEFLREGHRALDEIGMPPRQAAVDRLSQMLGDKNSRQTSSLYRNMLAGRPVEADPIVGDMLARVTDHRAYPLLSAAFARLMVYEGLRQKA